jgi:thioredoxin 1
MTTGGEYEAPGPTREEVDATRGPLSLEFGTNWCGYCQGARPLIEAAAAASPGVRRILVEDGRGRLLGRSFQVKLWPTLIFLRDGQEVARVVRPQSEEEVRRGFEAAAGASA